MAPPANWTGAGNVLTVTISSLTNGTGYTFEVRAFNSGGNGPASSHRQRTARRARRARREALSASPTSDSVTYTWTAAVPNGAPVISLRISALRVRRYRAHHLDPNRRCPYRDDLQSHQGHYLHLQRARQSTPSAKAPSLQRTSTPSGKPGAPQNLTATGGPGNIALSWDAPADNGGSAIIVNYRGEKYNTQPPIGAVLVTRSGTTSYTDEQRYHRRHDRVPRPRLNANTNDPSDWATVSGIAQGRSVPGAPTETKGEPRRSAASPTLGKRPRATVARPSVQYEYRHSAVRCRDPLNPLDQNSEWTSVTSENKSFGLPRPQMEHADLCFQVRAVNSVWRRRTMEDREGRPRNTIPGCRTISRRKQTTMHPSGRDHCSLGLSACGSNGGGAHSWVPAPVQDRCGRRMTVTMTTLIPFLVTTPMLAAT